jgi:HEAT repeat protein
MPPQVIPALSARLKADDAWKVRMSVIGALGSLRFHTNTTPLLVPALDDKDTRIRLFACLVFVELSREYTEPLHPRVVPTLIQLLDPKGEIEHIGQAVDITERLGTNGTACIPALRTLLTHDSPKVRHDAESALSRIEAKERRAE